MNISKKLNIFYKLRNGLIVYSMVSSQQRIVMGILNYDEIKGESEHGGVFGWAGQTGYKTNGKPFSFPESRLDYEIVKCLGTFEDNPELML